MTNLSTTAQKKSSRRTPGSSVFRHASDGLRNNGHKYISQAKSPAAQAVRQPKPCIINTDQTFAFYQDRIACFNSKSYHQQRPVPDSVIAAATSKFLIQVN
jgi:hypothetical protein